MELPLAKAMGPHSAGDLGGDLGPTTYSRQKAWTAPKQDKHPFGPKQGRESQPTHMVFPGAAVQDHGEGLGPTTYSRPVQWGRVKQCKHPSVTKRDITNDPDRE